MAGIVNNPLAIFRRPESPKPLHARWGDVAISVPTDGSWNQYNNPHRPAQERHGYGPGFVPDCPSSDRVYPLRSPEIQEDNMSTSTGTTSTTRRKSSSLGSLRPGRLSVRLASRPKPLRSETLPHGDSYQKESKRTDFAYKPIRQDYLAEVTENSKQASNTPFRYIPTNGRYLDDIPVSPRSQSARSHRNSHTRRDSFTDSVEEKERGREYRVDHPHDPPSQRGSHRDDNRQSFRSSLSESSDSSSSLRHFGLPPRRRTSPFVAADRKRASSMKPMTLAMVPDPEDLYE